MSVDELGRRRNDWTRTGIIWLGMEQEAALVQGGGTGAGVHVHGADHC